MGGDHCGCAHLLLRGQHERARAAHALPGRDRAHPSAGAPEGGPRSRQRIRRRIGGRGARARRRRPPDRARPAHRQGRERLDAPARGARRSMPPAQRGRRAPAGRACRSEPGARRGPHRRSRRSAAPRPIGDAHAGWRTLLVPAARAIHHEQLATDPAAGERRIVEFHRNRDRYMRKHHSRAAAAAVRALTAWAYLLRAFAALLLPSHEPKRYLLHARRALRPARGEGIREAAENYNRMRAARSGTAKTAP